MSDEQRTRWRTRGALLLGAIVIAMVPLACDPEAPYGGESGEPGEWSAALATDDGGPAVDGCTPVVPVVQPQCPNVPMGGFKEKDPRIASGALCRGACGADCHPRACTPIAAILECLDITGSSCPELHKTCDYQGLLTCGSHKGCREHDSCYDNCSTMFSGPVDQLTCRRFCDKACLDKYGARNCGGWANGFGPYDMMLNFSPSPITGGPNQGHCS